VLDTLLNALSDSNEDVRQTAASALATLRIDRMAVALRIEGLLQRDEHIASNQVVADDVTNSLLFALQQVIGEV
jgi:HEAT repeat protein